MHTLHKQQKYFCLSFLDTAGAMPLRIAGLLLVVIVFVADGDENAALGPYQTELRAAESVKILDADAATTEAAPTSRLSTTQPTEPRTEAPTCVRTSGVLVCVPELPTVAPPVAPQREKTAVGWIVGFVIACVLVVVLAAGLHVANLKVRHIRRQMKRALSMMRHPPASADEPLDIPLVDIGGTGERSGCVPDEDPAHTTDAQLPIVGLKAVSWPASQHSERHRMHTVSPSDLEGAPPSKAELLARFHALHEVDPELESLMSVASVARVPRDIFSGPNPRSEFD
jgi:hypothetical protein